MRSLEQRPHLAQPENSAIWTAERLPVRARAPAASKAYKLYVLLENGGREISRGAGMGKIEYRLRELEFSSVEVPTRH